MGISAVVLTYQCADEIQSLIPSISWCDEVILVDSHSTDGTRKIGQEHGAEVIDAPKTGPGEPFDHFRQLGVDKATENWVLYIDSDERIPHQLKQILLEHTKTADAADIVEAPRSNYLNGKELVGSGQWPDYTPILFRRDAIQFQPITHAFAEYQSDSVRRLPVQRELSIQHQFADSVLDHLRSQRRYAKIAGNHRPFRFRHLLSPFYGFYDRFVDKGGYRDGISGLGISLCWAWYQAEATVRSAYNVVD